jgi:hypothetical protein
MAKSDIGSQELINGLSFQMKAIEDIHKVDGIEIQRINEQLDDFVNRLSIANIELEGQEIPNISGRFDRLNELGLSKADQLGILFYGNYLTYSKRKARKGNLRLKILQASPAQFAFKSPRETQKAETHSQVAPQIDRQRSMPFIGAFRDRTERRKEEKLTQSYAECRAYAQERAAAILPVVAQSFNKVPSMSTLGSAAAMPKIEVDPIERGAPASYNPNLDMVNLNKNMYDRYMRIRHLQGKPREKWSEKEKKDHDTFDDILAHEFGHVLFSRTLFEKGLVPQEYERKSTGVVAFYHISEAPAEKIVRGVEEGIAAVVGRYVAARVNGGAYDNHSVASAILNDLARNAGVYANIVKRQVDNAESVLRGQGTHQEKLEAMESFNKSQTNHYYHSMTTSHYIGELLVAKALIQHPDMPMNEFLAKISTTPASLGITTEEVQGRYDIERRHREQERTYEEMKSDKVLDIGRLAQTDASADMFLVGRSYASVVENENRQMQQEAERLVREA